MDERQSKNANKISHFLPGTLWEKPGSVGANPSGFDLRSWGACLTSPQADTTDLAALHVDIQFTANGKGLDTLPKNWV
ncbi:hypothetical protein [Nostoc sp. CCY0012]|uniref:hypothetical protein n=1 Tax=Nostoc sp. CCY0012 TaxID=1056123 RepID=UPI0039C724A2